MKRICLQIKYIVCIPYQTARQSLGKGFTEQFKFSSEKNTCLSKTELNVQLHVIKQILKESTFSPFDRPSQHTRSKKVLEMCFQHDFVFHITTHLHLWVKVRAARSGGGFYKCVQRFQTSFVNRKTCTKLHMHTVRAFWWEM